MSKFIVLLCLCLNFIFAQSNHSNNTKLLTEHFDINLSLISSWNFQMAFDTHLYGFSQVGIDEDMSINKAMDLGVIFLSDYDDSATFKDSFEDTTKRECIKLEEIDNKTINNFEVKIYECIWKEDDRKINIFVYKDSYFLLFSNYYANLSLYDSFFNGVVAIK